MGSSSSLSNCAEGKTPKNPWVKKWWGGDDDSIGQYTVASSFSHHFHILHLEDKSSERSCMILLANDKNGPNFPTKQRCAEDNIVFPFVVYWAARWHFSSVSIEDGQRLTQHVSWDGWACYPCTRLAMIYPLEKSHVFFFSITQKKSLKSRRLDIWFISWMDGGDTIPHSEVKWYTNSYWQQDLQSLLMCIYIYTHSTYIYM